MSVRRVGGLSTGVFSPLVRGGINFSWQSHAAVIWFKGRCYYPDLAITAGIGYPTGSWTLSFNDKRDWRWCVPLRRNK